MKNVIWHKRSDTVKVWSFLLFSGAILDAFNGTSYAMTLIGAVLQFLIGFLGHLVNMLPGAELQFRQFIGGI